MESAQPSELHKPCARCFGRGQIPVNIPAQQVYQAAVQLRDARGPIGIAELLDKVGFTDSTVRAAVAELVAAGHMHRDMSANGDNGAHRWLITDRGENSETT